MGVAFFFRTTLPLEIYELAVVEIADRFSLENTKVKFYFDIFCFGVSVLLALILFLISGEIDGIGIGTVVVVIINSSLIKMWGKMIDRIEVKENSKA